MNRLMNKAMLASAAVGLVLSAGSAQAAWVAGFSGYSVFGAGAVPCPLCDSANDFAVWENESGNWTQDAPFAALLPTLVNGTDGLNGGNTWTGGVVDTAAQYVYLYQIFNTNPLGVQNPPLEDFNVSVEYKRASPFPSPTTVANPYTSGGYIPDVNLYGTTAAALPEILDTPFTWGVETLTGDPFTPLPAGGGAAPDEIDYNLIANPSVLGGAVAFPGIEFEWDTANVIPTDGQSALLFLTSDIAPNFVWAETQSVGGFGAAGDVPGVKLPLPASAALLGLGLVALGLIRRRAA